MHEFLAERTERRTVLTLRGELDLAFSRDELLAQLPTLSGGARGLVALDLSGVSFLDCSGLRALLALNQRIRREGGRLCLAATSPAVNLVLDLLATCLAPRDLFKPCPANERSRPSPTAHPSCER